MKTRKQLAIIAIIVLACTACDTGSSTGDSVKGDNPGNGPTIYTAGYYQKRYNNVACYWEGTTRTDLTVPDSYRLNGSCANAWGSLPHGHGITCPTSAGWLTPCAWGSLSYVRGAKCLSRNTQYFIELAW
jgi:hypothetical protein